MDVTMGLLAALLWGGTDFLVGLNARAVGVKRAVYFGQALGFLIMTLLLVIFPAFLFKSLGAPLSVWLLGIAAALLTALKANLPPFMQPNTVQQLDELPTNKNGKIDRTALAALTKKGARK